MEGQYHFKKAAVAGGMIFLWANLTACGDLSFNGPAKLDKTVDASREYPRAGHVYCIKGWLGIFSQGMVKLANRIDTEVGMAAVPVGDEEYGKLANFLIKEHDAGRLDGPLVLVGHSYGADDAITVAKQLERHHIKVDLLVTLDPVTPGRIPSNVRRCLNLYKSHPITDPVPILRGVRVKPEDARRTELVNTDLRDRVPFDTSGINHFNVDKDPGVHAVVMREIRSVCPPRQGSFARD